MTTEKRADDLEKASIDASVEGLKALLILNGGACISLLAFLSSMMGKERVPNDQAQFVAGATSALVFFAIAAGLAVVTCVFSYLSNQAYSSHLRWPQQYPRRWTYGIILNWLGILTALGSLGLFFFGVYKIWSNVT